MKNFKIIKRTLKLKNVYNKMCATNINKISFTNAKNHKK